MNTLNYKSVTSRVLAALAAGLLVFMAPLSASEVQAETSQPNEIWFNVNVKGENYAVLDFAFAPGSHTGLKPATICQTIQKGADKNKGTTTHGLGWLASCARAAQPAQGMHSNYNNGAA